MKVSLSTSLLSYCSLVYHRIISARAKAKHRFCVLSCSVNDQELDIAESYSVHDNKWICISMKI